MSAAVIVLGLAFLLVACLLGLVIVGAEEACHEWRERALAAERDREELQAREVMLLDDLDRAIETTDRLIGERRAVTGGPIYDQVAVEQLYRDLDEWGRA